MMARKKSAQAVKPAEPMPEAKPEPTEPIVEAEPIELSAEPEPPVAPLKSNARLQFPEFPDKRMKPNPLFVEVKSKRVQLLLQPSLYEKIKALAAINNTSFNEYVHLIFESFVREQK